MMILGVTLRIIGVIDCSMNCRDRDDGAGAFDEANDDGNNSIRS